MEDVSTSHTSFPGMMVSVISEINITEIIIPLCTIFFMYITARLIIRTKQADLIIHFHKQFDELQKKKTEINVALSTHGWCDKRMYIEINSFYSRFWSLQLDQFLAWSDGYIPTTLYKYWILSRWLEFHEPNAIKEMSFGTKTLATSLQQMQDLWKSAPSCPAQALNHAENFLSLIKKIEANGNATDINIHSLLKEYGPPMSIQIARRIFGAY